MNIALVLSGGLGRRLQSAVPKQYVTVRGKMIVTYCLERLCGCEKIDAVHIVADRGWWDDVITELPEKSKIKGFSQPGENRQLSILNGLRDISQYASENDVVLVHDAVRPLVSDELLENVLDAAKGHDGAVPVLPLKDTVYLSNSGTTLDGRLERGKIVAGQAPEAFVLGKYLKANEALSPEEIERITGSAEPALMAGMDIAVVNGEESNFKITTAADMERFIKIVEEK
jgi:2-C-methyl-D-erythritol 4-phosphate cytidylyltransferase